MILASNIHSSTKAFDSFKLYIATSDTEIKEKLMFVTPYDKEEGPLEKGKKIITKEEYRRKEGTGG